MLQIREFAVSIPYGKSKKRYFLSCAAADEYVVGWMKRGWPFEPFNLYVLSKILRARSVIFDVGAHIGTYSVILGKLCPQSSIYAFEPQVPLYSILLNNLSKNRVENCTPFNLAIAHRETISAMQRAVSDGTGTGKTVSYNTREKYNFGGLSVGMGEHVVACISLDSFVNKARLNQIDLLKIDVEGAEPFVFFGAREILKKHRPIIHFEANGKRITTELARGLGSTTRSQAAGFSIQKLLGGKNYLYVRMPFDNIMLVPQERMPREILTLFDLFQSDSPFFRKMYVFKWDKYSTGYRPDGIQLN